jgi:S-adenosylmethionine synthetase
VDTDGKGRLTNSQVLSIIEKNFDLSGGEIIKALDLRKPIYKQVSTYGHFVSPDIDLPLKIDQKSPFSENYRDGIQSISFPTL